MPGTVKSGLLPDADRSHKCDCQDKGCWWMRHLLLDKGHFITAHTKWECKYHIVFAPKYRRQVIYKDIRADVGQILGTLCRRKGVEIIEAEACPDHIHMLVRIPPKYSVSEIMGYLKGKSSLMIFEKHANLKYKYGNRHFWCRGYSRKEYGSDKGVYTKSAEGRPGV